MKHYEHLNSIYIDKTIFLYFCQIKLYLKVNQPFIAILMFFATFQNGLISGEL